MVYLVPLSVRKMSHAFDDVCCIKCHRSVFAGRSIGIIGYVSQQDTIEKYLSYLMALAMPFLLRKLTCNVCFCILPLTPAAWAVMEL